MWPYEENMNCSKQKSGTDVRHRSVRNWDIKDRKGRVCVVIQATSAAIAAQRVRTLWQEIPRFPRRFSVAEHEGPVRVLVVRRRVVRDA